MRSGIRRWIRQTTPCPACGAAAGEHCRAYVQKNGKTTGKPAGDVHAARWRAFRAWLRQPPASRIEVPGAGLRIDVITDPRQPPGTASFVSGSGSVVHVTGLEQPDG